MDDIEALAVEMLINVLVNLDKKLDPEESLRRAKEAVLNDSQLSPEMIQEVESLATKMYREERQKAYHAYLQEQLALEESELESGRSVRNVFIKVAEQKRKDLLEVGGPDFLSEDEEGNVLSVDLLSLDLSERKDMLMLNYLWWKKPRP